uniref:Uncharacterized protein LOC104232614 n=1 Tax=Nicotiana sylvestris TaxID=4096 RepID=A0A1U7XB56_NICSY|nr:PREDICTED: uncharacterized protein LOC104232614 [Nicotiana sylvestris]XP_009784165.1 PREDICTED: uncharacterized protein LOC104232614 [Nicotiana sylvestris]
MPFQIPKVRKIKGAKAVIASPSSTPIDIKYQREKHKGSGHASDRGLYEKIKVGCTDTSEPYSSGKKKTYGEDAIKVLHYERHIALETSGEVYMVWEARQLFFE